MDSEGPDQTDIDKPLVRLARWAQGDILKNALKVQQTFTASQQAAAIFAARNPGIESIEKLNRDLREPWRHLQPALGGAENFNKMVLKSLDNYERYVAPMAQIQKAFEEAAALQSKLAEAPLAKLVKQLQEGAAASKALASWRSPIRWISALESVPFPDIKIESGIFNQSQLDIISSLTKTAQPFQDFVGKSNHFADLTDVTIGIRQEVLTRQVLETFRQKIGEPSDDGIETAEHKLKQEVEDIEKGFLAAVPALLQKVDPSLLGLWEGACQAYHLQGADWIRHTISSLRELTTKLLHRFAPDDQIALMAQDPLAPSEMKEQHNGRPTRQARLSFIYHKIANGELKAFFQADIKASLQLVEILNKCAHLTAVPFSEYEGRAILRKVESLVVLLIEIST